MKNIKIALIKPTPATINYFKAFASECFDEILPHNSKDYLWLLTSAQLNDWQENKHDVPLNYFVMIESEVDKIYFQKAQRRLPPFHFGIIDLSYPIEANQSMLQIALDILDKDALNSLTLSLDLENLHQNVKKELARIEALHRKVVPLRQHDFHGLKVLAKIQLASHSGGDFLDFFLSGQYLYLVLVKVNSYQDSSIVFDAYQAFREKKTREGATGELNQLATTLNGKIKGNFDYCLMELNTANFQYKSLRKGEFFSYFDSVLSTLQDFGEFQRGHLTLICSPGFKSQQAFLTEYLSSVDLINIKPEEVVLNLFIQAKLDNIKKGSQTLTQDQSVVGIYVANTALVEI